MSAPTPLDRIAEHLARGHATAWLIQTIAMHLSANAHKELADALDEMTKTGPASGGIRLPVRGPCVVVHRPRRAGTKS